MSFDTRFEFKHSVPVTRSSGNFYISVTESAKALGVVPITVQRWIKSGALYAQKMPGKTGAYLIPRSEVERLVEERRRALKGKESA